VLVDSLLKAGAKVEVVDDDGVTPLQEGTLLRDASHLTTIISPGLGGGRWRGEQRRGAVA
jgi:hypothetical protein